MDRRIYVLTAGVGLMGANSLALAPIAPVVAQAFGDVPVAHVLWAVGGFGLGTAVSSITLAPYVDRLGAAPMLRWAMLALMACFVASGLAPNLWALIFVQTLAGIAVGVGLPATYGLGADITPKGQESRTMGLILTGWTLAMVFGVTCATLIADFIHWRVLFAVFAGIALVMIVALWRMPVPDVTPRPITRPIATLRLPGMARAVSVAGAFMLAFYATYPFVAPHVTSNLGFTPAATAIPVLTYGIGFGLSSLLDGVLDKRGYTGAGPWVFGAASGILASLTIWNDSFLWLSVALGLYGVVNHAGLTLILNRLIAVNPDRKGAILGMYSCLTYLCVTIGAVVFAPLYSFGGFAWITAASALFAGAMLAEVLIGFKTVRTGA